MSACFTIPHPTLNIVAKRCGPADEEPLLDRLETLLHQDYYFRRNHFKAILARPQAAVIAVLVEGEFAAITILYNGSTLQNLYVHPEHKRQGVVKAILDFFQPGVIRSKSNMSMGDPSKFYEEQGYHFAEADPHRPHIHLMTKNGQLPPPTAAAPIKPISEARRAQLDAARAKQAEKRRERKAAAAAAAASPQAQPPAGNKPEATDKVASPLVVDLAPPVQAPPTIEPAASPTGGGSVPSAAEPQGAWWPWPD